MKRKSLSIYQIVNKKYNVMNFEGEFYKLMGKPEFNGSWFIQGPQGNGKTSFTMMLCKYLTRFGKIGYNTVEEGYSESIKKQLLRNNMTDVSRKMQVYDKLNYNDLLIELDKKRSPKIIVIDTVQYFDINFKLYKKLIDSYPDRVFIFISHEESANKPEGRTASRIKQLSSVKIRVYGYVAFAISRYIDEKEGKPMVVWFDQAVKVHSFLNPILNTDEK